MSLPHNLGVPPSGGARILAYFAGELRHYRTRAGLTHDELAERIRYPASVIDRIEAVRYIPPRDLATRADRELGTSGALERAWELVDHATLPPGLRELIELEQIAAECRIYQPYLIPEPLRTAGYATAVLTACRPRLDAATVEQRLAVQQTRQDLVLRECDPMSMWAVIDEAALHRELDGDGAVMAEQCTHLLALGELPHVVIQILPFSAGIVAALGHGFVMLAFGRPSEPELVFTESLSRQTYIVGDEEIAYYRAIHGYLCSAALPEEKSLGLLSSLARW